MNKEEIKQVFLDNIEDNYAINLAIALAEEWEEYKNKIDEVREYIEKLKNFKIKYVMFEEKELYASENDFVKDILEILDKGSE